MQIVNIDIALVRKLIDSQFPQWSHLEIKPVEKGGMDNRTFHLGSDMSVRLPSAEAYVPNVVKEQVWLPKLAPQLSLPIPRPVAQGTPGEGYPWSWSVYEWIEGDAVSIENVVDLHQFAIDLGLFLKSLRSCDTTDAPIAGEHNFYRGAALGVYDEQTRRAIDSYTGDLDKSAILRVWEEALASAWVHAPVWIHGDVAVGNLLMRNGMLVAVIDFGCMAIGDPACDLVPAWTMFHEKSREAFQNTIALDDATWARAKGWALWKTLCAPVPGTDCFSIFEQLLVEI